MVDTSYSNPQSNQSFLVSYQSYSVEEIHISLLKHGQKPMIEGLIDRCRKTLLLKKKMGIKWYNFC